MQTLEPPHSHYLSAAEGWVGLGNLTEAAVELNLIPEEFQNLACVLEVRWSIDAARADWPAALKTAQALLQAAPLDSAGWLHMAYAFRRIPSGGLAHAWHALLPALDLFPNETLVSYNLACYACQLGRMDEARRMIKRAFRSKRQAMKQIALADSDLEPLWPEIRKL